MDKIPVSNTTEMPIYVAGCMIPAGETRHFDPEHVPAHLRPAQAAAPALEPEDPLVELSAAKVGDIVAALPSLSDEDLARLGDIEQGKGDKARKGVLEAIAELTLKRASIKTT